MSLGRPRACWSEEEEAEHTGDGGKQYGQSGKGEWRNGWGGKGWEEGWERVEWSEERELLCQEYHQGKL